MKKTLTTLLSVGVFSLYFAQWSPTSMSGEVLRNVKVSHHYSLDLDLIRSQLANAQPTGKNSTATIVKLPTLDGKIEEFAVYSQPVVEKSLAERYQLGSYIGTKVDDPTVYVRFSVSPYDLQAMMFRNGAYEFIEPVNKKRTVYGVFPKSSKTKGGKAFECKSTEPAKNRSDIDRLAQNSNFSNSTTDFSRSSDQKFRTYRLAISVTSEYTNYFGGVPQALAAINATMTRVNGVFEKDFAIRLIVQDFPQLIYTNPNTDPYSNASTGASGAWSLELQRNLTNTIGNAAYDIGHLFGRSGGGGSAGDVGNVCRNPVNNNDDTAKGSAYTSPGSGGPEGDNFDIDYVAHEMGHQFGADHSFSHGLHSAPNNTAHMEPGSGSTIMGYAGITNYDVQPHSDAYFLVRSIEQVQTYVNNQTCGTSTPIVNTPPVIESLPNRTIPKGTAFVLTASATDAEGDPLIYTWEQYDRATSAVTSVTGNNTQGPKFRSLPGTTSPSRYFPKLSNVLNGVLSSASDWEAVSNVARTMNFKVTVRDNNPDVTQQQTQSAQQQITVGNDGPFKVTTTKVYNNAPSAVTWDVVNTNNAPYNVDNVKIDYTLDNGTTWTILKESTPNDGEDIVDFSSLAEGSQPIIRVSAIDNVFYAVVKATVSRVVNCDGSSPASLTASSITQTSARIEWDAIANATYTLKYKKSSDTEWEEVNNINTNSYLLQSLTLNTSYDVSVAAICSGTVGEYANYTFTTKGVEYCTAGATSTSYEKIGNVTFANINNNSTSTSGYEDFTHIVAEIEPNKSYSFSASSSGNTYSTDQVIVWIDFNQDGDFDDEGEKVLTTATKTSPWTGNIMIPANAKAGNTRMRVRLHDTQYSPNSTSCGTSTYGQVEDYTVNIAQLAVSDVTKVKVNAYPNPVKNIYNIVADSKIKSVKVFDISGKQVINNVENDSAVKVDMSRLSAGIYLVTTTFENGTTESTKVIKK